MFNTLRMMLRKRREYHRNAGMDSEAYRAMQLAKFRDLAAHAVAHSVFYRDIVSERGIDIATCTPDDFPVLTKSELMANFDDIVTDPRVTKAGVADFLSRSTNPTELFQDRYRVIHTSGSSGEMGYFVYGPDDWTRGTATSMHPPLPGAFRLDRKKRVRKGKIRFAWYAATGGHFAGVTMVAAMRTSLAQFMVNVELFEVNTPMAETVARLNAFQPDIVAGYTGAMLLLASQQQAVHLNIAPQYLAGGGEGMTANDKAVLENTFGGMAGNGYGSSEFLMMGNEIPGQSTILLYDDDIIYDMQPDCTYITNLFNYTLPLIRYRMADVLTPVARKTFRHLPYPEIEGLIGRTEMLPLFRNTRGMEDSIHPITIAEIFIAGVQRFQMLWQGEDRFTFLVVLDPGLDEAGQSAATSALSNRLRELLMQKDLENVDFEIRVVDDLAVNSKTRKFQLIVDDRETG